MLSAKGTVAYIGYGKLEGTPSMTEAGMKMCKYFHLQALCDCFINIHGTQALSYLCYCLVNIYRTQALSYLCYLHYCLVNIYRTQALSYLCYCLVNIYRTQALSYFEPELNSHVASLFTKEEQKQVAPHSGPP